VVAALYPSTTAGCTDGHCEFDGPLGRDRRIALTHDISARMTSDTWASKTRPQCRFRRFAGVGGVDFDGGEGGSTGGGDEAVTADPFAFDQSASRLVGVPR